MNSGHTTVDSHTRISKNGKRHTVKQHNRSVNFAEYLPGKPTPKRVAASAGFATAFTGVAYLASTVTSVTAAMVWAVILVCLATLTYVFMSKGERKGARRKLRGRIAEKTKLYLRLWTHHRMAKFDKGRPEMRSAKPKTVKKTAPKAKSKTASEGVTHDSHFYCVGEGKHCKPGKHYDAIGESQAREKARKDRAKGAARKVWKDLGGVDTPESRKAQMDTYDRVMSEDL